jgi:hypothetical protein
LAERREARKLFGYFVWKITILRNKIIFFSNFRGHATGAPPPPLIRSWYVPMCRCEHRLCTDYLKDDSYPPILYKEDTKEIIISRKSKKDRQYNRQKKRDKKSNNDLQHNTRGRIISRNSQKDRQYNRQKKGDKKSNNCQQSNTQKTTNRATRTP